MSYTLTFRSARKADAEFAVVQQVRALDKSDRAQLVIECVCAFIDLLRDDETKNVVVRVDNSVWDQPSGVSSVTFSCAVSLERAL